MNYLIGMMLGVVFATYVIGFAYCTKLQLRLSTAMRGAGIADLSDATSPAWKRWIGVCLGVLTVPTIVGVVCVCSRNAQRLWEFELRLVTTALHTRITDGRMSWSSALRVQKKYAKTYFPASLETP